MHAKRKTLSMKPQKKMALQGKGQPKDLKARRKPIYKEKDRQLARAPPPQYPKRPHPKHKGAANAPRGPKHSTQPVKVSFRDN